LEGAQVGTEVRVVVELEDKAKEGPEDGAFVVLVEGTAVRTGDRAEVDPEVEVTEVPEVGAFVGLREIDPRRCWLVLASTILRVRVITATKVIYNRWIFMTADCFLSKKNAVIKLNMIIDEVDDLTKDS